MKIELDTYDFDIILACFWLNEEGKWEGVIKDNNLQTTDAKIIVSEKVVLVIRRSTNSN